METETIQWSGSIPPRYAACCPHCKDHNLPFVVVQTEDAAGILRPACDNADTTRHFSACPKQTFTATSAIAQTIERTHDCAKTAIFAVSAPISKQVSTIRRSSAASAVVS